jgi:hypothetical protein|tara:strand:+ start:219 stop:437 length:219 start_codon:yes stop_codon:yes gene_type:complete
MNDLNMELYNSGFKRKDKRVFQYNKNGKFLKEWDSLKEACVFYSCSAGIISMCATGKRKSALGFIWVYAKNL